VYRSKVVDLPFLLASLLSLSWFVFLSCHCHGLSFSRRRPLEIVAAEAAEAAAALAAAEEL